MPLPALTTELKYYHTRYSGFRKMLGEYERLHNAEEKNKAEKDFLEFQFAELRDARLQEDEQDEMERELEMLLHAGEIKTGLYSVWQNLTGEELNVLSLLKDSEQQLSKLVSFITLLTDFLNG